MGVRLVAPHTFQPWQPAVFDWMQTRDRVAVFLEMRLGKSLLTLRWLRARQARRVLLLAPVNPMFDWKNEALREGWRVVPLFNLTTAERTRWPFPDDGGRPTLFMLNYEGLLRSGQMLTSLPWDAVVCDESTRIRNPKASITKLVTKHFDHVPVRAILSGLPNPEHPLDLFCQFQFLLGHFCGHDNYWAYRESKFNSGWSGFDWSPRKGVRAEIKAFLAEHAYVLTQKKAGFVFDVDMRTEYIPMNTAQRKAQQQVVKEMAYANTETKWAPVVEQWLQRIAGGFAPAQDGEKPQLINDAKIRWVVDAAKKEFRHQPMVVWFALNDELILTAMELNRRGVSAAMMYGDTTKTNRAQIIHDFRQEDIQVLCIQGKLGMMGLDLSVADVMVYYSNHWDAEVRAQSLERIKHVRKLNQRRPLTVIDLVTEDSSDERVVQALYDKAVDARAITRTQLTKQVLRDLRRSYAHSTRRRATAARRTVPVSTPRMSQPRLF